VDVYDMQNLTPLRSFPLHVLREEWEHAQRLTPLRNYVATHGDESGRKGAAGKFEPSAVVFVAWLPQRPHAFVACTADGTTYVIDLLLGGLQAVDSLSSPAATGGLGLGVGVRLRAGCISLSAPVVPGSAGQGGLSTAAASHLAVSIPSSSSSSSSSAAPTCFRPIWDGWNAALQDRPRLQLERSDVGFRSVAAASAASGPQAEEEIEAALRRVLFDSADTGADGLTDTIVDGGLAVQRK